MEQTQILQEIRDDVRAVRSELTGALIQVASLVEWRKALEAREDERKELERERAHEKRIGALEQSKAYVWGVAAGVAFCSGALGSVIIRMVLR